MELTSFHFTGFASRHIVIGLSQFALHEVLAGWIEHEQLLTHSHIILCIAAPFGVITYPCVNMCEYV